MVLHFYFGFTKFLPDCGEVSFNLYLSLLTETFQKWPVDKNVNFEPSSIKRELYQAYVKNKTTKTSDLERTAFQPHPLPFLGSLNRYTKNLDLAQSRHSPVVGSMLWQYPSPGALFDRACFHLNFYMTKIPHFEFFLEPPKAERNQYKKLIVMAMEQGLVDQMSIDKPTTEEIITLGQLHWVYLQEKISQFKTLSWLQEQEKSSCDEPSLVYEFALQVGEILLPTSTSPYIELKQRDIFKFAGLSQTEINKWDAADNKRLAEFLEKYDQILLEAWGEKLFSENLVPLGVSLEEWLKYEK